MTDLEVLRLAARSLVEKEKVAYDPAGTPGALGVVRDAITTAAGRPGYEVLTENVPRAIGGALAPAARVASGALTLATLPATLPLAAAAKGGWWGAKKAGTFLGREALHVARRSPLGTTLGLAGAGLFPMPIFRDAAKTRGFNDDIARLAHGLPSSPVEWG